MNNNNDLCLVFKDREEANAVMLETKLSTNGLVLTKQLYKHIDILGEDNLDRVLVNIYVQANENREALEPFVIEPSTRTRTWFSTNQELTETVTE